MDPPREGAQDMGAEAMPTALDGTTGSTPGEEEIEEDLFADYVSPPPAEENEEEAAAAAEPASVGAAEPAAVGAARFFDMEAEERDGNGDGEAADDGDGEDVLGDLEKDLEDAMDELEQEELEAVEAETEKVAMPQMTPEKESPRKERRSVSESPRVSGRPSVTSEQGDQFVDESRFMRDENDALLHKWKVDYATRGGGGRAMCKDMDCLERHRQAGVRTIEKGELRIGRRVLMEKDGGGNVVMMWHHARCMFNCFTRARKTTRVIESPEDLEGFDNIQPEDQDLLRKIIAGSEDLRGAKFRTSDGARAGAAQNTPQKRGLHDSSTPAWKRRKEDEKKLVMKKGSRCWTYCRVRPAMPDRPGEVVDLAVRSAKPELGMVVEEEKDGSFIIQFESKEDEKDRLEKLQMPRHARIKGWLRYPRVFEGKKQRIPPKWIQWNRTPPRLCSCNKQEWAHSCDCGISCTRGTSTKVWGVCN